MGTTAYIWKEKANGLYDGLRVNNDGTINFLGNVLYKEIGSSADFNDLLRQLKQKYQMNEVSSLHSPKTYPNAEQFKKDMQMFTGYTLFKADRTSIYPLLKNNEPYDKHYNDISATEISRNYSEICYFINKTGSISVELTIENKTSREKARVRIPLKKALKLVQQKKIDGWGYVKDSHVKGKSIKQLLELSK